MLSKVVRDRPDAEQREDIVEILDEGLRLLQPSTNGHRLVVDLDTLEASKKFWHAEFDVKGDAGGEAVMPDATQRVQVLEDMVASRLGVRLHLHRPNDPDF